MKRLPMRKIREALRLSFEGLSTREMALSLALGRTTLREYLGRARTAGLGCPMGCRMLIWNKCCSLTVLTAGPNRSRNLIGPSCTPSCAAKA